LLYKLICILVFLTMNLDKIKISKLDIQKIIPLTFLINFPVLAEPQLIAGFIAEGKIQNLWFLWSSVFCLSAGLFFFSGLWKKAGISSENELHTARYTGIWANRLQTFRAIFLSLIILPLVNAQLVRVFSKVAIVYFQNTSYFEIILLIFIFSAVLHLCNSLRTRLIQDSFIGVIYLFSVIWIVVVAVCSYAKGDFSFSFMNDVNSLEILPVSLKELIEILFFMLIGWWLTGICDFPDMTGQKLLSEHVEKPFNQLLRFVLVYFFIEVVMVFAGVSAGLNYAQSGHSGEEIVAAMLAGLGPLIQIPVSILLTISFFGLLLNNLLWSDTLIGTAGILKVVANKEAWTIKFISISGLVISSMLIMYDFTLFSIVKYLFVLGAGVGPVFMLRWYIPQINALTQLTAMVSSLIYANLYSLYARNTSLFKLIYQNHFSVFREGEFIMQVIFTGFLTTISWICVMYLSKNQSELIHARTFIERIGSNTIYVIPRIKGFLLLSSFLILFKLFIWFLFIENYLLVITLFCLLLLITVIIYRILKKFKF